MLAVVPQANESGLKEVKSERDLLSQKTFSTKGTNTEIAAVGNDRFLTWLFNKAYNVCMKEKEKTVVEETVVNPMTVVNPQQAVEGEEDGMEVSEKCGDDIVDISVPSDAVSVEHQIDLICTTGTEALPSQSDHQLDKSQEKKFCAPSKTLPSKPRKRTLAGNNKVVDQKKRKGTQPLQENIMKVLKCMYCLKTFKSERSLALHQKEHITEQSYTTKIRAKKAMMLSSLKKHFLARSEKKGKQQRRTVCDNAFNTEGDLNNHLRIHTGEKAYKCTACGKDFKLKGNLKQHLLRHTGEKPYKCTVCHKAFSTKGNLNQHLLRHTGEKPYKCTVCHKAFSTKGTLKRHLRIHTGQKAYKCTVCDKAFSTKGNLNIHLRIHTGEKPYKCTVCEKAFRAKEKLNIHLRRHTGEKPYKCTVCDKAFSAKGDLNRHSRRHTGEKPYKCTVCGKAFSGKGDLSVHLRIHTGEKPYKCTDCDKAFGYKHILKKHLQIHTGEKA